jgi:hypothetical protein
MPKTKAIGLLCSAVECLVTVMIALSSSLACVIATAQSQNPKAGPAFDSVEIRAAVPNTMPQMRSMFGNGRYELHNATALDLIRTAWAVGQTIFPADRIGWI